MKSITLEVKATHPPQDYGYRLWGVDTRVWDNKILFAQKTQFDLEYVQRGTVKSPSQANIKCVVLCSLHKQNIRSYATCAI